MILHGKDLIVSIDGNANMASKSCTLNVSAKSIVKTSPTSGDWEEVLSGKKSWSLTTNHLVKAATAEAPAHVGFHAEIEITNSLTDGWRVVGNGTNGMAVYITDESSSSEGIHLMEMTQYGQYIRTTLFDKDGKYGNTQNALLNYLNGGSIDGHTIGNESVIILMTVGEFRMNSDICSLLSTTYHVAMPCMEIGKSPAYGNPTYDTTPLIVVGGKSLTYGYVGINSISNEILFNLINGNVPVQADGIPGHIKMVGKKATVRMKDEHGSEWVGQAEVTQFKVTGTKGNLMAGSFSFKGNGEIQTDSRLDFTPQKPTSYVNRIIIDMNQSNPAQMIAGDIGGDIFESIMSYAHRYLCKYQGEGEMAAIQLDDNNSTYFYNGQSWAGTRLISGEQGDVYVGFSRRFFYNIKNVGYKKYVFEVANVFMDGTWKIWEPHYLIAAFKTQATTSYNNTEAGVAGGDYYLRSIYKDAAAFADTPENLLETTQGMMNPEYFGLVGPEEHTIIALLYLMLKGNTNSRAMMGTGYSGILKTGITSNIGMRNTTGTEGYYVNIFGLENWWGGGPEVMERMMINFNNGLTTITPRTGDPITIQGPSTNHSEKAVIKEVAIGDLYMVPTEDIYPYKNEYFCDEYLRRSGDGYVERAAYGGGIFSLNTIGAGGVPTSPSRICFRGASVTKYTDPQDFLALTAKDPAN